MGKPLRVADLDRPAGYVGVESPQPDLDKTSESLSFLDRFLRGADDIRDTKGKPTQGHLGIRFECGEFTASVNDAAHKRFCVVSAPDLVALLRCVDDCLSGDLRVAWRQSKYAK